MSNAPIRAIVLPSHLLSTMNTQVEIARLNSLAFSGGLSDNLQLSFLGGGVTLVAELVASPFSSFPEVTHVPLSLPLEA